MTKVGLSGNSLAALLQGETDGSSYPTGGLRATHTAGAYPTPDPSSPPFIRDDVVTSACKVSQGSGPDETAFASQCRCPQIGRCSVDGSPGRED